MSEAEEVVPGALRSRNDQNFERELVSESLPHIESRRRLSLIWRPDPVPVDLDIPDSHDRRLSRWNVSELNSGQKHQSAGQSAFEEVGRQWMVSICKPNFVAGCGVCKVSPVF